MTGCSDCHRAGRTSSIIYRDVLDQCSKIRGGKCDACQNLSQIELKIEDVRRTLDNLLDERKNMASNLNVYHDNLVRFLPVELVAKIFIHCLPYKASSQVFDVDSGFDEKKHINAVLTLGHVSRLWRIVAQTTSDLWSIYSTTITPNNRETLVELTQEWLKRSASQLLFIQLRVDEQREVENFDLSFAQGVVTSTLVHAERWKVLSIEVPSPLMGWVSESLADRHLQALESLIFSASEYTGGELLHLNASPLRFTMRNAWLTEVSVDWSQLSHFDGAAAFLTMEEWLEIFRIAPHLSSCILQDVQDLELSQPDAFVTHSSLQSLSICHSENSFWHHFSFPSLNVLHILEPRHANIYDGCWSHVQGFLRHSDCKIAELAISDHEEFQLEVVETLRLLSTLERLSLKGGLLEREFFLSMNTSAISSNVVKPAFLGELKSLTCVTLKYNYDWSCLVAFINTMMRRRQRSLHSIDFRYEPGQRYDRDEESYDEVLLNEQTFAQILDTVHGLADLKIVQDDHINLVDRFCNKYGYHSLY